MVKRISKLRIVVKPECFVILALLLLTIPIQWITAWMVASLFHECCHFAALRLSGCRIFRVQVGLNGAVMDTDLSDVNSEILCALAGPIGGLLLILVGRWCPRIALCGLFQSIYNLIPIYPLDGGRAVCGILRILFSEATSKRIEIRLEKGILLLFLLLAVYLALCLKLGLIPLLLAIILILKNKRGKCTCKERALGVKWS